MSLLHDIQNAAVVKLTQPIAAVEALARSEKGYDLLLTNG